MKVQCRQCGRIHNVSIKPDDFDNWQGGLAIQHAAPYLSPALRELLISGTCGECFDNMFSDKGRNIPND